MENLEARFLQGKVLRRSLPVIKGTPSAAAPVLKRLQLPQGELAHIWNGDEPIRYIAVLELRAGTVRGNHYHLHKRELVYVISGQINVAVQDIQTRERATFRLAAGDLGVIDTSVAHVYEISQAGEAIEFSGTAFNAADSYGWDLRQGFGQNSYSPS